MARKTHRELIEGWAPYTPDEIARYVAKGIWHNLTVGNVLDRGAHLFPHKPAIIDDKETVTWKQLQERSNRLALHLHRMGVQNGDFLVMQTPNVVELFYFFFGLNRLGAIPVMCLPRHRRIEVDAEISLHQARGICVPARGPFDYVKMVEEIRPRHPQLKLFLTVAGPAPSGWTSTEDLLKQEIEKDFPSDYLDQLNPDPNDICCQQLSGGTTGVPKGIPRTHNDYICQWDYFGRHIAYTDDSIVLVLIPAGHNAAFTCLTGPVFFRGGTVVITNASQPRDHFRLIQQHRVTHTFLIPVQLTYWQAASAERKQFDLSSLKVVGSGAQKVRPEQARWCLENLGVHFLNGYGMSEGPLICTRWDGPTEPALHTVGKPVVQAHEADFRIVDERGVEVPAGAVGEFVSKGAMTFKGYFRNPKENAEAFDQRGYFHSGDLMSLRPDGRYVVEGRKKDMIIRGGENVYPEPIEDLLVKHPSVLYAAAVGMPDATLGERLCAFVQPAKGKTFTPDDMKAYLREQGIAVFQWAERLETVEGWPLTPVNKINKRLLRAWITAKLFREAAITKELGDEYLARDKVTIDDVISGKVSIAFEGTPV